VFKPWIPDTPATLMKCVDVCFEAMNLGKLVKEESEMTKLQKVVKKHISFLKGVHLDLVAQTQIVPYVSELDFVKFYNKCDFADESVKAASIDLIYVQVNTNNKATVGINRGEFIEALIRIARAKYKDTGFEENLASALDRLIE
jgi:hypothetical protein